MFKEPVAYTIKKSWRTKTLRVAVHQDGRVTVRAPFFLSATTIQNFLQLHSSWISEKINHFRNQKPKIALPRTKKKFEIHKHTALTLIQSIIKKFNTHNSFIYSKIRIKNHTTRWGSCSKKGNLNFNYRVVFLPETLVEYIVVHELAHLAEFNHSKRFWTIVARQIPEYKNCIKQLKGYTF